MNDIREYLCREAARLTDAAGKRFSTKEELLGAVPEMRSRYLEMMGIDDLPEPAARTPLEVTVTATTERDGFTVERLHYQSLPRLYVSANLYIPKNLDGPAPAVIYVCGHSPVQKLHFQHHGRRWAELGFVCLIVDTIQYGEIKGFHHGCYIKGWFHWYSRGYTPAGVELMNGIRGVDLLCARDEVDPDRIGLTGISGGGAMSWWLGAADERVKVVAPVCGTGTLRSHLAERTLDGHCDCMYFINYYGWDLADLGALIAPRPLLIGSADRDCIYSIASIRECYERARTAYDLLGVPGNITLVETPGPHSYHATSRRAIFSLFLRELCGRNVPPEEIRDVSEEDKIPDEDLIVYFDGPPADERTGSIHDTFVPLASPPEIPDAAALEKERARVVEALKRTTFNHFPADPCSLDMHVGFEFATGDWTGSRISFVPEEGWRLSGKIVVHNDMKDREGPVAVVLTGPDANRIVAKRIWGGMDPKCRRLEFEPRGVGETSWGNELCWHVRRGAAVTGRTVASMRVYDTLRAIEVARALPECDGTVVLAGQGEMAVIALYAALLDGNVRSVMLVGPPATQNAPSDPDGADAALEMLGVLRYTDLPITAGLLYPTELVFWFEWSQPYAWTEQLYARLGPPGRIMHIRKMEQWRA